MKRQTKKQRPPKAKRHKAMRRSPSREPRRASLSLACERATALERAMSVWDWPDVRKQAEIVLQRDPEHYVGLIAMTFVAHADGDLETATGRVEALAALAMSKYQAARSTAEQVAHASVYIDCCGMAQNYFSQWDSPGGAAYWYDCWVAADAGAAGALDRGGPVTSSRIRTFGCLGEIVFQITRLPDSAGFEICKPRPGPLEDLLGVARYIERLTPALERSGFRVVPLGDDVAYPATAALEYGVDRPLQQLGTLKADPDRMAAYRDKLAGLPRPWIGLAWCGGDKPDRMAKNMIGPQHLLTAFEGIPGTLIDLQHQTRPHHGGPVAKMRSAFARAGRPLLRVQGFDPVGELDDSLALMAVIDYAVSTDNSAAFLLPALGTQTYVLLPFEPVPFTPHWSTPGRWNTATEIRQPKPGDWPAVIAELRRRLTD